MDGNGLSKIDDANLASAILEKVNAMNAKTAIQCLAVATSFAILPQAESSHLVTASLMFGTLYALNGKIPKVE